MKLFHHDEEIQKAAERAFERASLKSDFFTEFDYFHDESEDDVIGVAEIGYEIRHRYPTWDDVFYVALDGIETTVMGHTDREGPWIGFFVGREKSEIISALEKIGVTDSP